MVQYLKTCDKLMTVTGKFKSLLNRCIMKRMVMENKKGMCVTNDGLFFQQNIDTDLDSQCHSLINMFP